MELMFRAESQENFSVSKKDSRPNNIVIPAGDLDYFNMVVIAKKLQGEILIFLQKMEYISAVSTMCHAAVRQDQEWFAYINR